MITPLINNTTTSCGTKSIKQTNNTSNLQPNNTRTKPIRTVNFTQLAGMNTKE